jgi:hypothetical protein
MQSFATTFEDSWSEFDRQAEFGLSDIPNATLEDQKNLLTKIVHYTSTETGGVINEGVEHGGNVTHQLVGTTVTTNVNFVEGQRDIDMMDNFGGTVHAAPPEAETLAVALLAHAHPRGANFLPSDSDLMALFSYGRARLLITRSPNSIYKLPLFGIIQTPEYTGNFGSKSQHGFQMLILQDLLAPNDRDHNRTVNQISRNLIIPEFHNPLERRYSGRFDEYLELLKMYSIAARVFEGSISMRGFTAAPIKFEQTYTNGLAFNTRMYALSATPVYED